MPRAHSDFKFRDEWLVQDKYKELVVKDGDPKLVRCKFCMKSFNIANKWKYRCMSSIAKAESHARMNSPLLAYLRKSVYEVSNAITTSCDTNGLQVNLWILPPQNTQ